MKYVVRRDGGRFWYWIFYSASGEAISRSCESYANKAGCLHSIASNKGSAVAPVLEG